MIVRPVWLREAVTNRSLTAATPVRIRYQTPDFDCGSPPDLAEVDNAIAGMGRRDGFVALLSNDSSVVQEIRLRLHDPALN